MLSTSIPKSVLILNQIDFFFVYYNGIQYNCDNNNQWIPLKLFIFTLL